MTRQDLAAEYVTARIEWIDAEDKFKAAEKALKTRKSERDSAESSLKVLIARHVGREQVEVADCAKEAITLADAVAWCRAAETAIASARDRLVASENKVTRTLDALVASGQVAKDSAEATARSAR